LIDRILGFLLRPQEAFFKAWQQWPAGSFRLRLDYDVFARPHYAYCIWHAARQAQLLGIPRISAVEFGVAGGNGLLELERLAEQVEREFSTQIEIYGFDTTTGLPAPADYRDLPYIWREGFFRMDVAALQARLSRARLVLGDVRDTAARFFERHPGAAPLGAVFADLDYYSSTRDAFQVLTAQPQHLLPRAYVYCDDVMSAELGGLMCDGVGQLLAIREYNADAKQRCLAPIHGLRHARRRPAAWNEKIYIHHSFDHPQYGTYIHADRDRQLPLSG
jgi:hypothetical protein